MKELILNNLATIIVGVIGIVVAVFLYLRGKKEKKPVYTLNSIGIVNEYITSVSGMEVNYLGQKVKSLTKTTLQFWNDGKDTINNHDIVRTEKIQIEVDEKYQLLSAQISNVSNKSNDFKLVYSNENSYILEFEYIDKGDNAFIEIYHTGLYNSVKLTGKIKGVKAIKEFKLRSNINSEIRFTIFGLMSSITMFIQIGIVNYIKKDLMIAIILISFGIFIGTFIVNILNIFSKIKTLRPIPYE